MPYNGWSSRLTWIVSLWLNNDEGLCHAARGLDAAQLREFVEEMVPDLGEAPMFSDMLNWVLAEVDWRQIAESFNEG